MTARSPISRLALWATVAVLALKSAVPLLASGAAALQGKGVAEICSIYGVDLPDTARSHDAHAAHAHHQHQHPEDGSRHETSHGSDHCALTGLAAGMPEGTILWPARIKFPRLGPPPERSCRAGHDACASWAARLKHGPPERS